MVKLQERRVPGSSGSKGSWLNLSFRVDKFNGQNYQLWKMQMEDYLYQKYLYLPLGGKSKQPVAMKDEEWEVLDRKALGTIWMCLASSVAFNILK